MNEKEGEALFDRLFEMVRSAKRTPGCPPDHFLVDYIYGLKNELTEYITNHLKTCLYCRREFEFLRTKMEMVEEEFRKNPGTFLPRPVQGSPTPLIEKAHEWFEAAISWLQGFVPAPGYAWAQAASSSVSTGKRKMPPAGDTSFLAEAPLAQGKLTLFEMRGTEPKELYELLDHVKSEKWWYGTLFLLGERKVKEAGEISMFTGKSDETAEMPVGADVPAVAVFLSPSEDDLIDLMELVVSQGDVEKYEPDPWLRLIVYKAGIAGE